MDASIGTPALMYKRFKEFAFICMKMLQAWTQLTQQIIELFVHLSLKSQFVSSILVWSAVLHQLWSGGHLENFGLQFWIRLRL